MRVDSAVRLQSFYSALLTLTNEVKSVHVGEEGRTVFVPHLKKDIAARLGVSTRTLQRWSKGESLPSLDHYNTVLKQGANARRRAKRHDGTVVKGVAISGHRRKLIEWDFSGGRPRNTGRTYDSKWVNYYVGNLDARGIFEVAKQLRDEVGYIQFIYELRHGDSRGFYQNGVHCSTYGMERSHPSIKTDGALWNYIQSLLWQYAEIKGYDSQDDDDIAAAKMAGERPNKILYIGANPFGVPEYNFKHNR